MKVFVLFFLLLFENLNASMSGIALTLSAMSSLKAMYDIPQVKKIFDAKGDNELQLKTVMFIIDDHANQDGAIKVHIVIVYDKELAKELKKMSSDSYFNAIDGIKKDFKNKILVLEWEFAAKKKITHSYSIKTENKMPPIGAHIFSNCRTSNQKIDNDVEDLVVRVKKEDIELKDKNEQDDEQNDDKDNDEKQKSPSNDIKMDDLQSSDFHAENSGEH